MNEQKKLYIILIAIVAFIVLIFGINFVNEYKSKKYLETFNSTLESGEKELILVARESCVYCQMFQPLLDYMKEQYGFEYLYVDTEKISQKGLNEVIEKLEIDPDDFGTPHLSLVENGKVVDDIPGYVDEQKLLAFLTKYEIAPKDSKSSLNYINFEQYKTLISSETAEIIVVGQTSCSACMMAKPVLLSIASKHNIKINYINLTEVQSSENGSELLKEFKSSLKFLTEEEWGTPLMIVVKYNEVIGSSKGYHSEEDYISFLKKQGFIGE